MNQAFPFFNNPPVVETAISVQFKPVEHLTNAHLGLFWHFHMREKYPRVADSPPLPPQMELFGDQMYRRFRLPTFQIASVEGAARLQMISVDDRTMVQIQNGRIVFNWRKLQDGQYPRWHFVLPAFFEALAQWRDFLRGQGLHDMESNQWEVTYVNQLVKGRDWNVAADWPALVPGLIGAAAATTTEVAEALDCNYRFALPENHGRLYVEVHHGFTGMEPEASEILGLQLTARGTVDEKHDIAAGMATGHAAIVSKFAELTGRQAHVAWERER